MSEAKSVTITHSGEQPRGTTAQDKLSSFGISIAGALSGAIPRLAVAPLDVVKIRLQLEMVRSAGANKQAYSTFTSTVRKVYGEEGLRTFWRGNAAAMMLWVGYAAVQFPVYNWAKNALKTGHVFQDTLAPLAAGAFAGTIASVISYPLDWARTRFAAQGIPRVYHSLPHLVVTECKAHGPSVMFQGLTPTLTSVVPTFATTFFLYEHLQAWLDSPFIVGAASGSLAKLLVYPLDTIKKRLQTVGMPNASKYGDYDYSTAAFKRHTALQIVRAEGVKALYRGTVPSIFKAACSASLTFWTYENSCRLLGQYPLFQAEP